VFPTRPDGPNHSGYAERGSVSASPAREPRPVTVERERATGYEIVQASRDFQNLQRRHRSFVVPLTIGFLCWYFGFAVLAAFAPGLMAIQVVGHLNVGMCLGLAQFVSTFTITILYARWATRHLDPVTQRLRRRLEEGLPR
jgi:uncharacterized membrane protein (DUF485 family)